MSAATTASPAAFSFGQQQQNAAATTNNNNKSSNFAQQLSDFWKQDDFAPLQAAGQTIMNCLREDESSPDADLYRRIASNNPGSHYYYSDKTRSNNMEEVEGGNQSWKNKENSPSPSSRFNPSTRASRDNIASPFSSTSTGPTPSAPPLLTLKHQRSIPLPPVLIEKQKQVEITTFMGLLAPAGLAWMSVDSTLYLWSIRQSISATFSWCKVPSGECIVSVGLVRPKKGIFRKGTVEWCLVIATPSEVLLYALAKVKQSYAENGGSSMAMEDGNHLRLILTSYNMPTENVRMHSIAGTDSGRIFLGGEDGCLYEMMYEDNNGQQHAKRQLLDQLLDQFYDHDEVLPNVITVGRDNYIADDKSLAKRAWNTVAVGISDAVSTVYPVSRPRKCRKVNRTSTVSSVLKNVLPEFVVDGASSILRGGVAAGGGKIEKIIVDEDRKCLYTLTFDGHICSFDLREYNNSHSPKEYENGLSNKSKPQLPLRLASTMDTVKVSRTYLEAVQRGQMAPYGSNIVFPGGSSAAQANVGDKEGARAILKRDKETIENNSQYGSILRPTSIHIIPPTESSRLTLLAVTTGGLRLYLSSLAPQVISTGPGNSSRSYGSSLNPLAPYRVMSLCNIRSPPPISSDGLLSAAVDSQVEDGVPPSVNGMSGQRTSTKTSLLSPLVDSCVYSHGIFVAAIRDINQQSATANGRSSNGSTTQRSFADMVVSLCPDLMKRRLDNMSTGINSTLQNETLKTELITPGGVSETVTFPMSSAYGYQASDSPGLLPGGIVLDVAILHSDKAKTMANLAFHSRTPTESELRNGLPQQYVPPDFGESSQRSVGQVNNGKTRALSTNNDLATSALGTIGGLVTNILLFRPIGYGIKPAIDARQNLNSQSREALYRLSTRDASLGFSTTAEEKTMRNGSNTAPPGVSKSTRLNPGLLHPDPVPLHDLSNLQYSTEKEIVMLNAGGLHFFAYETLSSRLADSINAAGENVRKDSTINAIFSSYGFKEGCAMCLRLAVEDNAKAIDAALARALAPKLVGIVGSGPRIASGVTNDTDPLVPSLYEFKPSAISQALFSTFARLTRPFWNKPALVVTEGRVVKTQWTLDSIQTPAKVELLLDEATAEALYKALYNLRNRMKTAFRRAIDVVPGSSFEGHNMMDIDADEFARGHHITRSLHFQSNLQSGDRAFQLSESETVAIAQQLEEKNIHNLYRLLARTVQVLDLVVLLRHAQIMHDLPEVDWGQLHGLTYRQLVQTSDGHERVERVLNKLVTAYASGRSAVDALNTKADELANSFTERCYLFFSPGSRLSYLGIGCGQEALRYPRDSSARNSRASRSAQLLREAAEYWNNAPLVSGRMFHKKGEESFRQIAMRAQKSESPLALAVRVMLQLEDVAAIVHICLTTASNFVSTRTREGMSSNLHTTPNEYDFQWEVNLYHTNRIMDSSNIRQSNRSPSSSAIVPFGTDVTANDAVQTCFALIFQCLSDLLDSRSSSADRMVNACASVSNEAFANDFFAFLFERNIDTLLRINCRQLDLWLQAKDDVELLLRYYSIQGRYLEAGKLASNQATSSLSPSPLEKRIYFLSSALTSFNAALNEAQRRGLDEDFTELDQKRTETEETLQIARLQNRIKLVIQSDQNLRATLSEDSFKKLECSLLDPTTLYKEYTGKLGLYDECLRLIYTCRENDPDSVQTLWMNIFADELLPCVTRSEYIYRILLELFDNQFNKDIFYDVEGASTGDIRLFDDAHWESGLTRRVKDLGKELYKPGADFAVPVNYLLPKLNALREALPATFAASWAPLILIDIGVPYLDVLDAFENSILFGGNFMSHSDGSSIHLGNVEGVIDILQIWITAARSDNAAPAKRQLMQATVGSSSLYSKIDMIKTQIAAIPQASMLLETVQRIEYDLKSFQRIF